MIFKKILRYLTAVSLVIATVFLITIHKTEAEDTSKLLDSKAVQKIVIEEHLMLVLNKMSLTLVTILLRPIDTKVWKLTLLKRLLMS